MPNLVPLIILLASLSGCTAIQDCHYETTNRLRTELAWMSVPPTPAAQDLASTIWGRPSHYRHGWKQGYYDVAMGGAGERPFLPPQKYWSAGYQNPNGERAIAMWYQGYHDGAQAAHQFATGRYHYLRPYGLTAAPSAGATTCMPSAVNVTSSLPAEPPPQLPVIMEQTPQPLSSRVSQDLPSWELMPPSPSLNKALTVPPMQPPMFEGAP